MRREVSFPQRRNPYRAVSLRKSQQFAPLMSASADKGTRERLQGRRWALNLSTYEVASRAQDHGWSNCTAKKVSQIENGKLGFNQDQAYALARALGETLHWLNSGHGLDGEPVFLVATRAVARAEGKLGTVTITPPAD
jgi:hypothetical protein